MNRFFSTFVTLGKHHAEQKGIKWGLAGDKTGMISKHEAWNLTAIAGATPPPVHWLRDLGYDDNTVKVFNQTEGYVSGKVPLSQSWQDLIKAAAIQQLCVQRNTPAHVAGQIVRPLRVLGTCTLITSGVEPWAISVEDVRTACNIADRVQKSGKLRELIISSIRSIFDAHQLCDRGPFYHFFSNRKELRATQSKPEVRKTLSERRNGRKLPESRALWELVRIVFTEEPKTFSDFIRFSQLKVLLLCGLRIGEVSSIPADWKRTIDHVDFDSRPAEECGGISRTLMLRHFAEKQTGREQHSVLLHEAVQHIPTMFEKILEETLDEVLRVTKPLRERLKRQALTGRVFPDLDASSVLPAYELYTRLTGNPQIRVSAIPERLVEEYRSSLSSSVLSEINGNQVHSGDAFINAVYLYWIRKAKEGWPKLKPGDLAEVKEIEALVRETMPTKVSDTDPIKLADGRSIQAHEFLFLSPKRALAETRNDGICDLNLYFSVGRVTSEDLTIHLAPGKKGIFARYGETEEDRQLGLKSHSLRHLQNTELFRLGISDAIITKRFNRKSVAQSYEYDHRTLAEELSAIDLPPEAQELPERSKTVLAMIQSGKVSGPIVGTFRKIQKEHGDTVAFDFLSAEADGFHATPYGYCVNSFTVDPCPKHLQCFNGCSHLVATDNASHRKNLERTKQNMQTAIDEISQRPEGIGAQNQLKHAKQMIDGIDKILATRNGGQVFEEGDDLSEPIKSRSQI